MHRVSCLSSRVESSRVESSRAESNRIASQSRAFQSHCFTEQSIPRSSRVELNRISAYRTVSHHQYSLTHSNLNLNLGLSRAKSGLGSVPTRVWRSAATGAYEQGLCQFLALLLDLASLETYARCPSGSGSASRRRRRTFGLLASRRTTRRSPSLFAVSSPLTFPAPR